MQCLNFGDMHIEAFRDYCLKKPGTTEHTPFGPDVLVIKVLEKVFAITDIHDFQYINLKCDPAYALELREAFGAGIRPGYHMNKKHWNSVNTEGVMPDDKMYELIDHSYDLVVATLTKKMREKLKTLSSHK